MIRYVVALADSRWVCAPRCSTSPPGLGLGARPRRRRRTRSSARVRATRPSPRHPSLRSTLTRIGLRSCGRSTPRSRSRTSRWRRSRPRPTSSSTTTSPGSGPTSARTASSPSKRFRSLSRPPLRAARATTMRRVSAFGRDGVRVGEWRVARLTKSRIARVRSVVVHQPPNGGLV